MECTVSNGEGTATGPNTEITIDCQPATSTVGGVATGLGSGEGITLSLNDGTLVEVFPEDDGTFTLPGDVQIGDDYVVTMPQQPDGMECTVSNGEGTATGPNTEITIDCQPRDPCADVVCQALDNCHDAGICVEGTCTDIRKADFTSCTGGVCQSGMCEGEAPSAPNPPLLGDSCGGLRESTCGGIYYAVMGTGTWNPDYDYQCPPGYVWITTTEFTQLQGESTTCQQEFTYHDKCGWNGYTWGGVDRSYFRFEDSDMNNGWGLHVGTYDSEPPNQPITTTEFAGIICAQETPSEAAGPDPPLSFQDECGGFRESTCGGIHFAVMGGDGLNGVNWDPYYPYKCPAGYEWMTKSEFENTQSQSTTCDGSRDIYVYYNQCGWGGYNWNDDEETRTIATHGREAGRGDGSEPGWWYSMWYFRFKDSTMHNGWSIHAGHKDFEGVHEYKQDNKFAGIICAPETETAVGAEPLASETSAFTVLEKVPDDYKIAQVLGLTILMGISSLALCRQMKNPLSYKEISLEDEEI